MNTEDKVEMIEVWTPCKQGEGTAIRFGDGKNMKMVAKIINGMPLYLEKDVYLETQLLTKQQANELISRKKG